VAPFGASGSSAAKHGWDVAQISAATISVATRFAGSRRRRPGEQKSAVKKFMIDIAIPFSKLFVSFRRNARRPSC
jgi:hypothetical protein